MSEQHLKDAGLLVFRGPRSLSREPGTVEVGDVWLEHRDESAEMTGSGGFYIVEALDSPTSGVVDLDRLLPGQTAGYGDGVHHYRVYTRVSELVFWRLAGDVPPDPSAGVPVYLASKEGERIRDLFTRSARYARLAAALRGSPWIPVDSLMPKPGRWVLAAYVNVAGKPRVVRAFYASDNTVVLADDQDEYDGCTYDVDSDQWYCPAGWYECNDHDETNWRVTETVTHWMPLPSAPYLLAGVTTGASAGGAS